MFFSIIIPTCNRPHLLVHCLERLRPGVQTLQGVAYELIVSDDSSGTETAELIAEKFPFVQWVAGPRRGPAANRNNGARLAKGEWLVFLDDDCEPCNNLLLAYWEAIQNYQQEYVFEGKIITNRLFQHAWEIAPLNVTGGKLWSCNFTINAAIFNQVKGFDECFKYPHMEDIDLSNRIKKYSEIIFVKQAYVTHPPRLLPNGIMLGLYHESDVYYHLKYQIKLTKLNLIKLIVNERIRRLLKNKFSLYTLKGFYYLVQELIVVQLNFHKWSKKYKNI
ncbi:MAG: glycosyltransferase [Sphingobacteriales bacterium]|uniref:glycosyltransferase family 2 protein n=1 Tax=Hydrotalea flava TaxID=714549 RepID=UPI0008327C13|nr:glycosyltransferase [Hydrotalea flava]RTL49085.1 MAG: glycosyltransferase [Sphingobacteriales bacterium]